MDTDEVELEDGEIPDEEENDDFINKYIPLERPSNYSTTQPLSKFPPKIEDTDSEDEIVLHSDESDSDSDNIFKKTKKPKIVVKRKTKRNEDNQKRKRYDIWSSKLQTDIVNANFDSCDVTTKDKSRDVESYDYTLAPHYYEDPKERSNKRTRDDRKRNVFFPRKREPSSERIVKPVERIILDLNVDTTNNEEDITKDIANKLCEEREDLILKVIYTMGKEKSIEIFNETKRIEKEGGMLIRNQTRRRTPGGVFLYLVRNDYYITPEQKKQIFDDEKQRQKNEAKERQKQKNTKLKSKIMAEKSKLLPDLLTRAEQLAKNTSRHRKEDGETNVINPPPTPETDCPENSSDGADAGHGLEHVRGKLENYEDDFLDIACSNDMDMF